MTFLCTEISVRIRRLKFLSRLTCWSLWHTLFLVVIKNNLIFCHQFQNAAAKIVFPAGLLTRPSFHSSCNPPVCLAYQLLFSAFNDFTIILSWHFTSNISSHLWPVATLASTVQLLHCQARTFTHFPDYKVFSVKISSKKILLKVNFLYQIADLLHASSVSSFVHSSIFSSVDGSCHSQIGIKNIYTTSRLKKGKCWALYWPFLDCYQYMSSLIYSSVNLDQQYLNITMQSLLSQKHRYLLFNIPQLWQYNQCYPQIQICKMSGVIKMYTDIWYIYIHTH